MSAPIVNIEESFPAGDNTVTVEQGNIPVNVAQSVISGEPFVDTEEASTPEPTGLAIEPYNERSFKVVGNSRPFRFTLRSMGGKWNRNLEGGKGWIFSVERQEAVQEFINRVNNGEVEPDQVNPAGRNMYHRKNFKQNFRSGLGQQIPAIPANQRVAYSGTLNYYVPTKGQTASIRVDGETGNYQVINVEATRGTVDKVWLLWPNGQQQSKAVLGYNPTTGKLRWWVEGLTKPHTIKFH